MELRKTFRFEASHVLSRHTGKCRRLHGHSWQLTVSVEGPIEPSTGFVMDYHDISLAVDPVIKSLDHHHLGEWTVYGNDGDNKPAPVLQAEIFASGHCSDWPVPSLPLNFYPTSENLLCWIAFQLTGFPWSRLELNETCTSAAILTREEYEGRNKSRAADAS